MLTIREIKVEITKNNDLEIKKQISQKLKIDVSEIKNITINKQSLDARDKNKIYYVYECNFLVSNEDKVLRKNKNSNLFKAKNKDYIFNKCGNKKLENNIIIVGSGPAGLFCSYILCENGYKPIIIERGEKVEDRVNTVNKFWDTGVLNKNSNVQFGEGGAGTFSDGKLNTLIKDKFNRIEKVLNTFVKCKAPKEILYSYKPHIGTDLLVQVVKNMREEIIKMGGVFRYNSTLTNIFLDDNKVNKIEINNNEIIDCEVLVLAIGHSARDTFKMLYDLGIDMESKPFAVGLRVQHNQDMINLSQYGSKYKDILPPASYKLTYKAKNGRGVYSFCMCPGGYVVNSSSEDGYLVVNGMSNNKRESSGANSAIVVTVNSKDYGEGVLDGVEFQKKLEKSAYNLGKGKIPVQTLNNFCKNKIDNIANISPLTKGKYKTANLNDALSIEICDSIKEAFPNFANKIKGFDNPNTLLFGIESRTSSPIRIKRKDNLESNIEGIYPCGEGCGYAGGITSAAVDGIKVAEEIGKKFIVSVNH